MIKKYNITVNGTTYEVEVEEVGSVASNSTKAAPVQTATPSPLPKAVSKQPTSTPSPSGGGDVNAPMPGTIFEVKVNVGQQVKKGDVLVILEAMKMENEIMAPHDGVVSHIHVSKGASVSSGDPLVTLG